MLFKLADSLIHKTSPSVLAAFARKTPIGLIEHVTRSRFRDTVRWAGAHSPFYRRAFAERGINPRAVREPSDLGDFYTTPDDIVAHAADFLCKPASIVFESSGTSGKNKQVYYSEEELRNSGMATAAGYYLMGLDRSDRVANAFDFSIWIPGMICHYGLMASGMFSLAFGKVDPIEVYNRLAQYKFTAVMGEPTWLIRLTEIAEEKGPFPLKLLLGGAEEMPAAAIPWMEKIWAPAKVKMGYGSVELGGGLGFQPCDNRDWYHMDITDYRTELLEPNSDGYGELVFTTLARTTMPLIRYRTRDIVKFNFEPCPCGFRFPRMSKIHGRRDELVVASGGNLYPKMFENIFEAVAGLTSDWQVVFKLEGIREVMELNVESNRTDSEAIEREIHRQMAVQYPDLMKNLGLGIFQMRLVVQPVGSLRETRKLKRLVDRRYS